MKPLQASGSVLGPTCALANAVCNAKSTAKLFQLAPNPALKEWLQPGGGVTGCAPAAVVADELGTYPPRTANRELI
jgi:hypothetical protein